MKMTRIAWYSALVALLLSANSCDFLLGKKPIYLASQADEIAMDIISQSKDILRWDTASEDLSIDYDAQSAVYEGSVEEGTAEFVGGLYDYDYYYYYSSMNEESYTNRDWIYDDIEISYEGFVRFGGQITIDSGSLVLNGSEWRDTTTSSSYYGGSNTTEGGTITIKGKVEVSGVSSGEDVKDSLTVNFSFDKAAPVSYTGTRSNSHESWDIYIP